MWSICETLYSYEYSKVFLVGVHVRTHMNIRLPHVFVDWQHFTSHGHRGCQTNNVGSCETWDWTDPTRDDDFSLHNLYAVS